MDFFEVVKKRRSIRRFTSERLPREIVDKALDAALLAPNSSNAQTWDFYWVETPEIKKQVAAICLNQSAARTASGILIVTADPKKWQRSHASLQQWVLEAKAPPSVQTYYSRLFPMIYRWGFLNSLGWVKAGSAFFVGLLRPIVRGPFFRRDIQEVAVKSAALAAENFVLAITAQGAATCMMEGLDERRMKKLLKLSCTSRIVMAIGCGFESERGTWAPQYRLPREDVVHTL